MSTFHNAHAKFSLDGVWLKLKEQLDHVLTRLICMHVFTPAIQQLTSLIKPYSLVDDCLQTLWTVADTWSRSTSAVTRRAVDASAMYKWHTATVYSSVRCVGKLLVQVGSGQNPGCSAKTFLRWRSSLCLHGRRHKQTQLALPYYSRTPKGTMSDTL